MTNEPTKETTDTAGELRAIADKYIGYIEQNWIRYATRVQLIEVAKSWRYSADDFDDLCRRYCMVSPAVKPENGDGRKIADETQNAEGYQPGCIR